MTFPSGFLIVDKPSGVTSFAMVALVRRLTGVRRVGHAGTLDPLATGVLPVAVGQATRFIEFLDDVPKTYVAHIRFGVVTDTYDAEGAVTSTADASSLTDAALERLLPAYTGDILQTPPAFSALKVAGKPLYSYARKGQAVALQPRRVQISGITVRAFESGPIADAEIEVTCGKGTYIRSLAHDVGQQLGVGAHLTALRRTTTGGFSLQLARTPAELTALAEAGHLERVFLSIDRAVERREAAILAADHASDVRAGRDVSLQLRPESGDPAEGQICRAYDTDGHFLGILRHLSETHWHPAKVLPES